MTSTSCKLQMAICLLIMLPLVEDAAGQPGQPRLSCYLIGIDFGLQVENKAATVTSWKTIPKLSLSSKANQRN